MFQILAPYCSPSASIRTAARSGPVRLRDVDETQALLVNLAKDLAAKGEITLTKNRADDELVY